MVFQQVSVGDYETVVGDYKTGTSDIGSDYLDQPIHEVRHDVGYRWLGRGRRTGDAGEDCRYGGGHVYGADSSGGARRRHFFLPIFIGASGGKNRQSGQHGETGESKFANCTQSVGSAMEKSAG